MQLVLPLTKLAKRVVWRVCDQLFAAVGLFCVEVDAPDLGFFAFIGGMVPLLASWQSKHLKPYLVFSSKRYLSPRHGPNFLEYFFEGPRYTNWQRALIKILPIRKVSDWSQVPRWSQYDHPSIADGIDLFNKYFQVRQEMLTDVETLANTHIVAGQTLGVHYRGTDKWSESTHLSFEDSLQAINLCLKTFPSINHLFVSTDNQAYGDFIRQSIKDISVSQHADHLRSADGVAVHLSQDGDPYLKGYEALVNCLLLSRCTVLLKSLSNLSAWACIFNCAMPVYLMNKPAGNGMTWLGFPELEMVRRGWFAESLPGIARKVEEKDRLDTNCR